MSVCAGEDAKLLSTGEVLAPLFGRMPPPAEVAACTGCMPAVKVVNVTWDGVGTPKPTDTTSCYELILHGDCALKAGRRSSPAAEGHGTEL